MHVKEEPSESDENTLNKDGLQVKISPSSGLCHNKKKRRKSDVILDDSEDDCTNTSTTKRIDKEDHESAGKNAMLEDEDGDSDVGYAKKNHLLQ